MIRLRPFRNSDPPRLAEIWRSQPPSRWLVQPMTAVMLDELVLSKPYFDREGLIVAEDEGAPVGFAHAGFAANANGDAVDYGHGATCLLLTVPRADSADIARSLLAQSEQFLTERGATTLSGGASRQMAAFYFGLYGGSCLPGTLASDEAAVALYREAGYEEQLLSRVYQRDLGGFRLPIDRQLIQVRRQCRLDQQAESHPATWWEASMFGRLDRLHFSLTNNQHAEVASATFWDIEPLASSWGVHAMGLTSLDRGTHDDAGPFLTFLIGESMRQMQSSGTTLVEIQASATDEALNQLCERLGFEEVDRGLGFTKCVSA